METFLGRVAFSVGATEYCWEDVLAAARAWRDWDRVRDAARETLACLERLSEDEGAISEQEVEAAADEFRYSRDLVSAEEMEAWLDRWDLAAEDWMDWIRGGILRKKWSGDLAEFLSTSEFDEADVEAFARLEAVCSGGLERLAKSLAVRAAVARKENGSESSKDLARLDAAFERFRRRALTPAALDREIRSHRTEWTRLECRTLAFRAEEEAREAALCLRDDGATLEDVAARAGVLLESERIDLDRVDPGLFDGLLAARPGDLVGPLRRGEDFVLFRIVEKAAADGGEAADVRRAEERILARTLEREVGESIRWAVPPRGEA